MPHHRRPYHELEEGGERNGFELRSTVLFGDERITESTLESVRAF